MAQANVEDQMWTQTMLRTMGGVRPDYGTSKCGSWQQPSTQCCLLGAPQVPHGLHCDSSWPDRVGKKPSLKADLVIYSYIATVSGQCVAITLSNKMDFSYCDNTVSFHNPVTYVIGSVHTNF